jgi:hypothetical protein
MSTTDFCSIFSFKLFITPPGPSLLTATLFPETPLSLRSCGLWTLSRIDIAHQRTKPAVHAMAELIFQPQQGACSTHSPVAIRRRRQPTPRAQKRYQNFAPQAMILLGGSPRCNIMQHAGTPGLAACSEFRRVPQSEARRLHGRGRQPHDTIRRHRFPLPPRCCNLFLFIIRVESFASDHLHQIIRIGGTLCAT